MATIGGKEFINRGTAENPIYQRVGGGGGGGGGGGANVTTDETPPLGPSGGDLWYDTSVAKLYVYIDGTGWFQANGGSSGGGGTTINFIDKISVGAIAYGSWTTVSGDDAWSEASGLIVHADSFDVDTGGNSSIELKVRASSSEPTEVLVIDHNGTSGGRQITQEQAFIPVASDGSFQYYITRDSTNATIRNFNVAGFLSSSGGGGGGGGGASVSVGIEAPTSKTEGDLWFSEEVGSLFVYIEGTGWVETNPGGGGGGGASAGYGGSSVDAKTEEFFYSDAAYTTPVLLTNDTDGARFYNKDEYIIVNLLYAASSNQSSYIDVTYYPPGSETGYIVGGTRKGGSSGHGYMQNITFVMAPQSSCQVGNTNFSCRAATVTLLDAGGGGGGGGPRAYVAFDGAASNMSTELASANSYNIASITDNGIGNYTITFDSEVIDPVITIGHDRSPSTAPYDPCYLSATSTSFVVQVGESESNWPNYAGDVKLSVVVH